MNLQALLSLLLIVATTSIYAGPRIENSAYFTVDKENALATFYTADGNAIRKLRLSQDNLADYKLDTKLKNMLAVGSGKPKAAYYDIIFTKKMSLFNPSGSRIENEIVFYDKNDNIIKRSLIFDKKGDVIHNKDENYNFADNINFSRYQRDLDLSNIRKQ